MPVVLSAKGKRFLVNHASNVVKFRAQIKAREAESALLATQVSRATFTGARIARPLAPARHGRPSTQGLFTDHIEWKAGGRKANFIDFSTARLKKAAPYYLIQEIGTGHSAVISNPKGIISVRSQVGRTIPFNLYWAKGIGGSAVNATTGATGDQLYLAADLNAKSLTKVRSRRKRIRREIKGRHYLQAGGVDGLKYLGKTLDADARKIFR